MSQDGRVKMSETLARRGAKPRAPSPSRSKCPRNRGFRRRNCWGWGSRFLGDFGGCHTELRYAEVSRRAGNGPGNSLRKLRKSSKRVKLSEGAERVKCTDICAYPLSHPWTSPGRCGVLIRNSWTENCTYRSINWLGLLRSLRTTQETQSV